ncbi:RraA family protein [Leucobacter sp. wl10]|uniref:RraA family protein n=1 Tax=Leucobacter sp. wl10 TaxID=2304677 RepID=UPI000E5AE459|nr:4-carboxy-4-hydroxy-2-oxoadipate aldolase/oxaloacetate decarboxylase [Leucobacter sp. wl10]RGE18960.1 4-carboxy-4-hydroxy-2-oxoadipate aldolase/oxaloacetate decarboxylase [Leucobacter sp. wl10]
MGRTQELTERLRDLDSCAVSDALDALGLRGAVLGLRELWRSEGVVAGPVRTVRAGPRESDGPADHVGAASIEAANAGEVLVIANDGRLDVSCFGGILARAASRRELAGVVIDGACRDIGESRALGFPVFGRAVLPVSARGRIVQQAEGVPIAVGEMVVRPGDLVIADENGVVFVPADRAGEVVELAERLVRREAEMAEAVERGESVVAVMHDSRFPGADPDPEPAAERSSR